MIAPDPAIVPLIIQTEQARHVLNTLYPAGAAGDAARGFWRSLCRLGFDREDGKLVRVPLIPAAAICPACVAVARRWYAGYYFEPFTTVQRWRLLAALTKDLATVPA